MTLTVTGWVEPQAGLAEMFTIKVPRFPLPVLDPMETVTEPEPEILDGETVRVTLFPLPANAAVTE